MSADSLEPPLKVGLVQINNSFSGQNYLPYSVGMLQAYAEANVAQRERVDFLLPIYHRLPVEEAVSRLIEADVVGFSTYVWNVRLSLRIAEELKARKPELLILFGGPQVPDQSEGFLREHPFIDLAVNGEGEQVFTQLLDALVANPGDRTWEGIGSLSFIDRATGKFVFRPKVQRLKDLDAIPSPYLSGTFDALMAANPDERWLVLWETNRGCPFGCTFCDWGSAVAAKVFKFGMDRLVAEIDWVARQQIEFIFCCDANYGMLPRDLDLTERVAEIKQQRGYPKALSVQNTKNATERAYKVQKLLADAGLNKGVTISMQSMDPSTLKAVKRANISTDSFQELQRRFTRDRVETYSDMILGMPEETYDSFVDGCEQIVENGQHNRIQFNNLSILPNAEMGDPEYQRRFGMQLVETRIINIHGSLDSGDDDVTEYQQLVVATDAMPPEAWVRTRAFCWMMALLHFDKVMQVPIVLLRKLAGVGYRQLVEAFSDVDGDTYPTLGYVRDFFRDKARDIQGGGEEYCRSEKWLNIWWPADELVLINLTTEGRLETFYVEAEALLSSILDAEGVDQEAFPRDLLTQAVRLNRDLIKRPFQTEDLEVELDYNVWEVYRGVLTGDEAELERGPRLYVVDRTSDVYESWEDWCQRVIWYGNKKGAYLYPNRTAEAQLEGHF